MLKSSNITIIATETFKNDPSTAFLKVRQMVKPHLYIVVVVVVIIIIIIIIIVENTVKNLNNVQ